MNFLNKYKHLVAEENAVKVTTSNVQQNQHLSREDYFKLTIGNDIEFDQTHPYFDDQDFFSELFIYFEQMENYEMCGQLIKLKK